MTRPHSIISATQHLTTNGTSPNLSAHSPSAKSPIGGVDWKTAKELEDIDTEEGGPPSYATTLGRQCMLDTSCVAPKENKNLYDPKSRIDTLHSKCWKLERDLFDKEKRWPVPTSQSTHVDEEQPANSRDDDGYAMGEKQDQ